MKKLFNNQLQIKGFKFCFSEKIKQTKAKQHDNITNETKINLTKKESDNSTVSKSTAVSISEDDNKPFKIKTKEEISYEYQDKLFYFNYQWNKIQKEKKMYFQDYLSPDLNNHQQLECDSLIGIIKNFNSIEKILFLKECETYKNREEGPTNFTPSEPPKHLDPNFYKIQEILYSLQPFLASKYFLGGKSKITEKEEKKAEVKEQVKEEKPKEKLIVNVKYSSFDQAKKIALIKEFRTVFNLGLKEAKEAVENVPSVLKKDMKKEEALELKNKLEAAGAKIDIE